jgi:large subunit ribosomal protein L7Ae
MRRESKVENGKWPLNKRLRRGAIPREERLEALRNLNATISRKKRVLEDAIKCPPPLFQFRKEMDEGLKKELAEVLEKYRPETPQQKRERTVREKEHGRTGPRPIISKFGLRHIVKLIEMKKTGLVLIANDVDPIEMVLFLPALCKKMGVSYAIYGKQEVLGGFVGMKRATCIALADAPELPGLTKKIDALFSERYPEDMKTWGKPARR